MARWIRYTSTKRSENIHTRILSKEYKTIPLYKLIKEAGTKHKPKFLVSLKIKDYEVVAEGVSKQKAEILAAKKMIKIINKLSK